MGNSIEQSNLGTRPRLPKKEVGSMCSDDNNAKMALQDEVIADSEDDESYYPLVTSNAGKAFSDLVDVSSIRRVGELSIGAVFKRLSNRFSSS